MKEPHKIKRNQIKRTLDSTQSHSQGLYCIKAWHDPFEVPHLISRPDQVGSLPHPH